MKRQVNTKNKSNEKKWQKQLVRRRKDEIMRESKQKTHSTTVFFALLLKKTGLVKKG